MALEVYRHFGPKTLQHHCPDSFSTSAKVSVRHFCNSAALSAVKTFLTCELPYFPVYKPRLFKKKFTVAAYIAVRLMCGRFQKTTHYTLHAAACLDQHLITISSPTVLHNH